MRIFYAIAIILIVGCKSTKTQSVNYLFNNGFSVTTIYYGDKQFYSAMPTYSGDSSFYSNMPTIPNTYFINLDSIKKK